MRLFVALRLPEAVQDDLADFLGPRQEAGPQGLRLRRTMPEQWHVTLAFLPDLADRHTDELFERLQRATLRRNPLVLRLFGAGAFPNAARAKVLWTGVEHDGEELMRLAGGVRAAASKSGTTVGGGRFHPHLTLARLGVATDVMHLLDALEQYESPPWQAREIALIASYLGQGPNARPRHEVQATFTLGPA